MNVVYYTYPHFFDPAIHYIEAISDYEKIDLFLELSPYSWQSSMFDLQYLELPGGIIDGKRYLKNHFPVEIGNIIDKLKRFNLVVYKNKKSISYGSIIMSINTAKYIKSLKPNIIHFDGISLKASYGIRTLKENTIICNIHDPFVHTGEANWRKTLTNWLTYPYIKYFVLFNRHFVSEFSKKNNIPYEKIVLSKLGVYDLFSSVYKDDVIQEDGSILFIGRLSKYKGVEIFLEAIKLISKELSGYKFIIAGKPHPGYKLPDIPSLPNGNVLVVIDKYLSNKQVSELIQKSSIIVCPYLDATQSGVILTAYAFNKPVIATNVGGLPEYVWDGETGVIIPPNDPYSLKATIIKLMENPEKLNSMKTNIISKKQKELSWGNIANTMLNFYRKINKSQIYQ